MKKTREELMQVYDSTMEIIQTGGYEEFTILFYLIHLEGRISSFRGEGLCGEHRYFPEGNEPWSESCRP